MALKSQQDLYNEFIEELQANAPNLTDTSEGSDIDIITQVTSFAVSEILQSNQNEMRKTFFDTAHGPEVTGSDDDLQTLAVDHFGDAFKRPEATFAKGIVTFSRANTSAGNVIIPAGTVIKTVKTSGGNSISFKTEIEVTMTGLSVNASVIAESSGTSSNVQTNTLKVLESSLSDQSVVVINSQAMSGGAEAQSDAEYRITIKRLFETLKGATLGAIQSKALTVAGVVYAKALEKIVTVKEWNVSGGVTVGDYFKLPQVKLYISDANGSASSTLINAVKVEIDKVRAAGVFIDVLSGTPVSLNWSAQISLNPLGPNYSTLQSDLQLIKDEMSNYISALPIGSNFVRSLATDYILSKYGPSGTNDLTSFVTTLPIANVTATEVQKFIPNVMAVS